MIIKKGNIKGEKEGRKDYKNKREQRIGLQKGRQAGLPARGLCQLKVKINAGKQKTQ